MKRTLIRAAACALAALMFISSAWAYDKLEKGAEGPQVLNMQLALRSLGYSIEADGKYGPATVAVVRSFQRRNGLTADGVAGNKTLSALYAMAPAYAPREQSASPTPPPYAVTPIPQTAGDTVATVATTGRSLNLRQSANSASKVIGTIPNGEKVIVTMRGSAWACVIYNGMTGYVMTDYLSFSSGGYNAPTAAPTSVPTAVPTAAPTYQGQAVQALVVTTGGSLNLRETAVDTGRIIGTIPYGAWVTVNARGEQWSAVVYNGVSGYVMSKYLSFGAAAATSVPTAAPTQTPYTAYGETAYVSTTGGSLNLRQNADASARVLTAIPNGAQVQILSRGTVWCTAVYQGVTGFVMTSFLRFSANPSTPLPTAAPTQTPYAAYGETAYVKTSGGTLNLRQSASTSAKVLFSIPNGAALQVTGRGASWCAVTYQGISGYVMTSFLSFPGYAATPVPTAVPTAAPTSAGTVGGVTALITTSGGSVNLRSQPSSSAQVTAAIPNASAVQVLSRGAEWSAVVYNGASGYVMSRYLTFLGSTQVTAGDPNAEEDDPSAFTRVLKKGMTGADVTWVQTRLSELGYSLQVTNVYDDATFSAVKAFQSQNGLTNDGLAGSQTFALLRSANARQAGEAPLTYTTLRIDDSGDGVKKLQSDLKGLGYPVTVNGSYDTDTHNAVVAFQQRNGLVISGIADSLTRQIIHGGGGKPYSTPVETLPANEGWIAGPSVSELKLLHWQNEIKPTVKSGQTFTVFDPNTNLSWRLVFYSLGRHADCQPVTWKDTQIMNHSFGNTSWTIHPVYVRLPSGQWTLATMHNRPHLYGTIADNGFGGHLCVHFLRDMAEAQKNDPDYGVNNQVTLRNAWKALTGETVN